MKTRLTRRTLLSTSALGILTVAAVGSAPLRASSARRPNVVVIYADDLGYRDLSCFGMQSVATPNIDRLAKNGVTFTNAHAPSATCTPSRYALLTGEYAWRKEGAHILPGDAPALIAPGKPTMASMFKSAGYATSVIGKWHLGLGNGHLDWNGKIAPGPLEIGFDYAFYFPATLDRVPCVFIENHSVVNLDPRDPISVSYTEKVGSDPTGRDNPDLLRMTTNDGHDGTIINGVSRIGFMAGGHAARWTDEEMADTLVDKASRFFEQHRAEPFFMYFSASEIHVPRLPARRFAGKSRMGPRGDAILEFDWVVGALTGKLHSLGLLDDTLIVLSSDNGPVLNDGYDDDAVQKIGDHRPSGPHRSGKYSIFDGGLMVPMIAHWPNGAMAGITSPAPIDHVDLFASLTSLAGQRLADDAAVDSFDLLPTLTGKSMTGRAFLIEDTSTNVAETANLQKYSDSIFALVVDGWKVIRPQGVEPRSYHGNEIGNGPAPKLFNIAKDPGETIDLSGSFPDHTARMLKRLDALLDSRRTR